MTKDCRLRIADFGLARERPTGHGTDPDEEIDGTQRPLYQDKDNTQPDLGFLISHFFLFFPLSSPSLLLDRTYDRTRSHPLVPPPRADAVP